jgi:hypothetical protein
MLPDGYGMLDVPVLLWRPLKPHCSRLLHLWAGHRFLQQQKHCGWALYFCVSVKSLTLVQVAISAIVTAGLGLLLLFTASWLVVGVHRQSHRSPIVDPLNVTPRTHLVRTPCVVNAKCDTRSPIVVSFQPPRPANAIDPHNQPRCKWQYTLCALDVGAGLHSTSCSLHCHLHSPFSISIVLMQASTRRLV